MNVYLRSLLALMMSAGLLFCGLAAATPSTGASVGPEFLRVVLGAWTIGTLCCAISFWFLKPRIWWPYVEVWALLCIPVLNAVLLSRFGWRFL